MSNIKKARLNAGLSQKIIALSLGVSAPTVSEWESGKKNPNSDNLRMLSEMLNVTSDYLLGLTDDPTPKKEKAPSDISTEEALEIAFTDMLGRKPTEDELRRFWEMGKLFFDAKDKSPD